MTHLLSDNPDKNQDWLKDWMEEQDIELWGIADLRAFDTPKTKKGNRFPFAIAWVLPMNPHIMKSIQNGPNQEYANEYSKINQRIDKLSKDLATAIEKFGFHSFALAASKRTDTINIKGDFPHKTAATRAGLGWIGSHCQLITRPFGPWVRLATVFTDMSLDCDAPIESSFCGKCTLCVDACPANALLGATWHAGLPREKILDVKACDLWKKENYYQFHQGHNCGICSAICPFGVKSLKHRR